MKLGLQLFSLIGEMQKPDGLRRVLRYAADAGYDGVEFAGFYGLTIDEINEELTKNHLLTAGIHLGWDEMSFENLDKKPEAVIEAAKKLGAYSTTIASFGGQTRTDWEDFAAKLDRYGRMFREAGIRFGYHNHRHEVSKLDGDYIIDILMENTAPENLVWELDPRHIALVGEDYLGFAKKYAGRLPFLHMRDFDAITGPDTANDCAVGDGLVDNLAVVRASGDHDWLIVEEGPGSDNLAHIARSAEFLRKNLRFD